MISDGIDRYNGSSDLQDPCLAAAIEDARHAGVVVFVIYTPGVGHYSHSYWRTIGGRFISHRLRTRLPWNRVTLVSLEPVTFIPYLGDLAQRLTSQYLLTLSAKPQKKNGLQPVKVITEVPNAELFSADRLYISGTP
jgi:hypothetical protein